MEGVSTFTDPTGSFIANVIRKTDRNEVQIYPINKDAEEIILATPSRKFELPLEHNILSVTWVEAGEPNDESSPSKKRGSKRALPEASTQKLQEISTSVRLVVLVESGSLLVFTPYSDEIFNTITPSESLHSIAASLKHYSVLGFNEKGHISEVSLNNSEVKTFPYKNEQAVSLVKSVNFKANGSTTKSKNVLLASHDLYLADLSRSNKKALVTEFSKHDNDSDSINFIQQSRVKPDYIYVSRQNSDRVYTYNLTEPKVYSTLKASTSKILNLQVVSDFSTQQEFILAFTDNGIEVFHSDFDISHEDQPILCLIKTNFHDSSDPILFTNAVYVDSTLIGIWHNRNQPQFNIIDWDPKSAGEVVTSINYHEEDINGHNNEKFDFQKEDAEIHNLPADELVDELASLLTKEKVDREKVISLCSSNDDEANIKETVQSLGSSNAPAITLFEIVSKAVSSNPSKGSSLSIWLKWILITRGGFISKQSSQKKNLKNLKTNLDEGMKLLPRLLALQGRLQLLKSQAELRNKVVDYEPLSPEVDETFNDSFGNGTTVAEESIVFANGENDDFEDIEKDEGSELEIVQEDDDLDEAD